MGKHRSKNVGAANARFIARGANGEKQCSKCRRYLPLDAFPKDRSRYDGRSYVCRECNSDRVRPGPTIFVRREAAANGKAWCRRCSGWAPIEKVRGGLCRKHAAEEARERYATNSKYRAERRQHAHARKRGVDPIPVEGQENIYEEFDGRCAYCGSLATTWDHVVPISAGGLTEPCNIVPACAPCNSSKKDRNVWEWLEEKGLIPCNEFLNRLSLYEVSLLPGRGPDPFD